MPIPKPEGWDEAKEGFDPIPAGVYTVEVIDAEEGVAGENAKNPGSPKINVRLQVIDDEDWEGRNLFLNLSFTPKALGMVKGNLRALGYSDDDFASSDFEVDADDLIGRKAKAVVNIRKNPETQEPQNNVRRLMSLDDVESALPG